jgi:hypothetical protein
MVSVLREPVNQVLDVVLMEYAPHLVKIPYGDRFVDVQSMHNAAMVIIVLVFVRRNELLVQHVNIISNVSQMHA